MIGPRSEKITMDKTMKTQTDDVKENGKKKKKGFNHMWMMAICCGLPIVGFMVIGALGISSASLETLLFWICPIGMGAMMLMMHRKNEHTEGSSCCESKESKQDIPKNIRSLQESESK
jgi:hypothetical protein